MLVDKFPELLKEWDYEKNTIDPKTVKAGSAKKVNWVCIKNNKHKWDMQIRQRAIYSQGCSFCSGRRVLPEESIGANIYLMKEWDYENNIRDPLTLSKNSGVLASWKCEYGHHWDVEVFVRNNGSRCPYCTGHKTPPEKSIGVLFPELTKELFDDIDIFSTSPNSHMKVNWKCGYNSKHIWPAVIKSRTRIKSGCPFCIGLKVLPEDSFGYKHPELLKKWSYDKNKEDPFSLGVGSGKKIWWRCDNNHLYLCSIRYMISANPTCSECYKKGSRTANNWLDELGIQTKYREYYIKLDNKKFFVDGFDPKTNTVYEYYGNFWHGNPKIYDMNKKHPYENKTYGQLFNETIERENILKNAGYRVIYKWGP